jgi:hypothetical protein
MGQKPLSNKLTFVIEKKFSGHISPKKIIKLAYSIYVTEKNYLWQKLSPGIALAFVLNILLGEGIIALVP